VKKTLGPISSVADALGGYAPTTSCSGAVAARAHGGGRLRRHRRRRRAVRLHARPGWVRGPGGGFGQRLRGPGGSRPRRNGQGRPRRRRRNRNGGDGERKVAGAEQSGSGQGLTPAPKSRVVVHSRQALSGLFEHIRKRPDAEGNSASRSASRRAETFGGDVPARHFKNRASKAACCASFSGAIPDRRQATTPLPVAFRASRMKAARLARRWHL